MDYTWIIYILLYGYRYFWIQWNAKHCDTPCLGPFWNRMIKKGVLCISHRCMPWLVDPVDAHPHRRQAPLWCVSQPILEHPQYLCWRPMSQPVSACDLCIPHDEYIMICYIILQHTTAYYIITSYYMMYHHDVDISLLQARLLSICLPSTCSAGSETSPWSCVLISRWAASADFAGGSVPAVFRWSTLVPSMKASALIPKPFYMQSIPSGKLT